MALYHLFYDTLSVIILFKVLVYERKLFRWFINLYRGDVFWEKSCMIAIIYFNVSGKLCVIIIFDLKSKF